MSFASAAAAGVVVAAVVVAVTNHPISAVIAGGVTFLGTTVVLTNLQASSRHAEVSDEPSGPRVSKKDRKAQAKAAPAKGKKNKAPVVESDDEPVEEKPKSKKKDKKAAAPAAAAPTKGGKAAEKVAEKPAKGKKGKPAPKVESEDESEEEEPVVLSKSQQKKAKAASKAAAADVKKPEAKKDAKKGAAAAAPAPVEDSANAKKKAKAAAKAQHAAAVAAPPALEEGWTRVDAVVRTSSSKKRVAAEEAAQGAEDSDEDVGPKPTTLEFSVPSKHHPVLIGKGGENLKLLSSTTGANIQMPKKDSGSLIVTLSGSAESVSAAKSAIDSLITRGFSSITNPGFLSDDMRVEEKDIGLVVGPKGVNLQNIQRKTGTNIRLPEKGSGERLVIVGEKENVKRAKQAIKDLIRDGFSELTNPGFVKVEIEFPKDKLALLIGAKGQTIKSIQGNTRTQIKTPKENGDPVIVSGLPAGVAQAQKEIARLLEPVNYVVPDEDDIPEDGAWGSNETAQGEDALW